MRVARFIAQREASVPQRCRRGGADYRTVAFVHINKAGGTAMRSVLQKYAAHQLLELLEPNARERMSQLGSRFFHGSAALQREAIGDQWDKAFTFALVRNPYARQVSMFHFLMAGYCGRPSPPIICKERMFPVRGDWLKDPAQAAPKFRSWLLALRHKFPPGSKKSYLFGSYSHGNARNSWFNASQLSWFVDASGKLLVQKVIKLEELESRWPSLRKSICGLSDAPISNGSMDGGVKKNPSSHAHYATYYDETTRRIVEEYAAADLNAFGYRFEEQESRGR